MAPSRPQTSDSTPGSRAEAATWALAVGTRRWALSASVQRRHSRSIIHQLALVGSRRRSGTPELQPADVVDGGSPVATEQLLALHRLIDERDPGLAGHSQRVTRYGLVLAAGLGVDRWTARALHLGAPLHDLGKIGLPDAILLKPGPLDLAEWEQMQRHPELGYRLLRRLPRLAAALPLVRYHHERWDGTGYPRGLAAVAIPLSARIFSLADAFDAMTADRPYRRALSGPEARARILAESGRQFDPQLVEVFEATFERLLDVRRVLTSST